MHFKVTVQLTVVTLTVDVRRMTTVTSRSWGAIWKWSETVTYGCHAICCHHGAGRWHTTQLSSTQKSSQVLLVT